MSAPAMRWRTRSTTSSPRRGRPRRARSRPISAPSAANCACSPAPRWWSMRCAASATPSSELDRKTGAGRAAPEGRGWYDEQLHADRAPPAGQGRAARGLPANRVGAPIYLQYHYIVDNPHPPARRKLVDDAGDGSAYSEVHARLPSAAAHRGVDARLLRLPDGRSRDRPTPLRSGQGSRFRAPRCRRGPTAIPTSPPPRPLRRRRPILSATCLEDFAPLSAVGRRSRSPSWRRR